jgi:HAD superfamily hydrolase (TIGR01509 family)
MDCVLFDLDGTVADTEVLKAQALSQAVQSFGQPVSPEIYKSVMGQSWEAVTNAFFNASGVAVALEEFNPVFRQAYSQLIDQELIESRSINRFISFLKSNQVAVGLVSSASPWMIQKTLAKLRLENAFEVVISNADTEKHKPHPDAYLIALEKLGMDSDSAIAFEDSESGFKAANAARLEVYGVRHAYNARHDFSLCKEVISSFEECLNWKTFSKEMFTLS